MRLALAVAGLLLAAPAAQADIFAVTDAPAPPPRTDTDVALLDLSTGGRGTLPAAVNSLGDDTHPSVTSDGNRLVFQRDENGATRILVASLPAGTVSDLFNVFEQSSNQQISPAISPDGATVATGELFQTINHSAFSALTLTDVSSSLSPPFARSQYTPQYAFPTAASSLTSNPVLSGDLVAFKVTRFGFQDEIVFGQRGAQASLPLATGAYSYDHPSIGAPGGVTTVVFDQRAVIASGLDDGEIAFRPGSPVSAFAGPGTLLPPIVNTPADESRPALTADGRYLAFIRRGTDGHERVFVLDTGTQTLINPAGVDLKAQNRRGPGNLSLYVRPLFKLTNVLPPGLIDFQLLQPTGVGILVQRIVGQHKLLGRTVPTLSRSAACR